MHARMAALAGATLACVACWPGPGGGARAQPGVDIPQYQRVEQAGMLARLRELAGLPTPTGAAAQAVLAILVPKITKENDIILPPQVLLSALAEGEVTPEMRWAIALADRVKSERDSLRRTHEELNKALLGLRYTAAAAGDLPTVGFTNDLIADDLGDQEIEEPTAILIGEFLRSRLPAQ